MSNGSTIVLVHGAWHGSWCWERVVPLLEGRGFDVRTIDLPSVGAELGGGGDLRDDAAAVEAVLDAVGGPIVLCGHSYGGMVISRAAAGHPNVKRLVYLCAFMPEAGQSLVDLTGGKPEPWVQLLDDGRNLPDVSQAPALFYGDCDAETARRATSRLRPMPVAPFIRAVRSPAWREIPATYVVCARDAAIPAALQRDVFAPRADETLELDCGHSPFFADPAAVAELLAARA